MSNKNVQDISLMELYKLGSHRGNKKSKLNPKLKRHVYGIKNGLSLIDLNIMLDSLASTEEFLHDLGKRKRQVLLVGTDTFIAPIVKDLADKMGEGMPFVNKRWLGGTLTNWPTVRKTIKKLEKNQKIIANEEFFNELPRNEKLLLERETEKLSGVFEGLKPLKNSKPSALIIMDGANNAVAVAEAEVNKVPVIALMNTGSSTLPIDLEHIIVCNNKSIKLVELLSERLLEAYNSGYKEGLKEDNEKSKTATK